MKKPSKINFVGKPFEGAELHLRFPKAMTLVEIVIALAMLGVIFAAILPQFRAIFNGWDSKQASAEILQNGRILIDHLNRNLSKAMRITAVSPSTQTNGYIEFHDNTDTAVRYDVSAATNYVEFGQIGSLSDLAGPVSQLQFTCYDACNVQITDVTKIRSVQVASTFTNPSALGQSKAFTTQAYIRTNYQADDNDWGFGLAADPNAGSPWYKYDATRGLTPSLCQIDGSHYLCAYDGTYDDGWAVVLQVNPASWFVSRKTPLMFDSGKGLTPALAQINSTHYLCAYQSSGNKGVAVVLEINTSTWNITAKTPLTFDGLQASLPALTQIDSTHYLCTYTSLISIGEAVVLEINTSTWNITKKSSSNFASSVGASALAQIDNNHYICTYIGPSNNAWAVVLTVNTATWAISTQTALRFDNGNCVNVDVAKIDGSHFLCAYQGTGTKGYAAVLAVNTGVWTVTKQTSYQIDTYCALPTLIPIATDHYVCAYTASGGSGKAVSLRVRTDNWNVIADATYIFNASASGLALADIDSGHCISAYAGSGNCGYSGVLKANTTILP